jgi:hypothetical protein
MNFILVPKKERKRDFTKVVHYNGHEVAKCKSPLKKKVQRKWEVTKFQLNKEVKSQKVILKMEINHKHNKLKGNDTKKKKKKN